MNTMQNVFQNLSWQEVEAQNEELCSKSGHQFGRTSDGYQVAQDYFDSLKEKETLSLGEAVDSLRALHRLAPFLFLNGNTLCVIARDLVMELAPLEVKFSPDVISMVGHHVAGVSIISLDELCDILNGPDDTPDNAPAISPNIPDPSP